MKTILFFTLTLLTFVTLTLVPNSFAQDDSPEYVVRLIYFVPNDRQPDPDIDATIDTQIKDVQTFYADQMEQHGLGRKTFSLETDETGNVVVHRINGKFNDTYYHNGYTHKIIEEFDTTLGFDSAKNIYVIIVDISLNFGGSAVGNFSFITNAGTDPRFVIGHELGHNFGLEHDFRTNRDIMSYASWRSTIKLSQCAADWLDVHPYFNESQNLNNNNATIQMLAPAAAPPNAIRLRFEITDADGLHQAQLVTPFGATDGIEGFQWTLSTCKRLNKETTTIVEFVTIDLTQDVSPNATVVLRVIDVNGHYAAQSFQIELTPLLSANNASIPDAQLAVVVRDALGLATGEVITLLDMKR